LFLFLPYKVDVHSSRKPFANYLVMIAMVEAFALQLLLPRENAEQFVLREQWSVAALFGYMWLHLSYGHIIGNLVFLWVFGNAVCSKVGNILYLPLYISTGLVAAVIHLIFDGREVVGASGAIFGVVGAYFVLYPFNSIKCFFWFIAYMRRFSIAGIWIILLWIILNLLAVITKYTAAAYFAHIGGFVAGVILAIVLLKSKLVIRDSMNDAIIRSLKI
jgi:membrane associated rhomboid family serine protease